MQSSTISICLVKCLLIPRDQNILMNLNLLYYPWSMYPGKHGEAQFCPILNCFAKPQNEAMLAAKSGWTLGQVLVLSSLPMPSNLQPCNQWVCKTGNARVKHMLKCTPLLHCTLFIILSLPPILYERIQHLTSSILPAKSESLHQCEMDNKVER